MNTKEAIERIKTRFDKWALDDEDINAIQTLIPELKGSENERIRKEAISIVQSYMNICDEEGDPCLSGYEVLAWLEKQGKRDAQEDFNTDYEENYDLARNALGMLDAGACYMNNRSRGEVLAWLNHVPHIIKQLSAKIAELKKQKEQKPAEWSKNDTIFLNEITDFFENKTVRLQHDLDMYAHWLKSLPERFNLLPKNEWNEEEKKFIKHCAELLDAQGEPMCALRLESLPPHWKPSEEQIRILSYLAKSLDVANHDRHVIDDMIDVLKKL